MQQANTALPLDQAEGSAFELIEENSDDDEDEDDSSEDIKHKEDSDSDEDSDDEERDAEAQPQIVMVCLHYYCISPIFAKCAYTTLTALFSNRRMTAEPSPRRI